MDCLVQERRNSSELAMELRLSCTNPSICYQIIFNAAKTVVFPANFEKFCLDLDMKS